MRLLQHVDWQRNTLLVPISKSGPTENDRAECRCHQALAIGPVRLRTHLPIAGHPFASLFYPWDCIRHPAGLTDVRLHDLRHSFASFLVNQGVSLYLAQGLLGHTQVHT